MPFPANPSVGDTYVENNNTYKYLGPTNGWYRTEVRPSNDTDYRTGDGYIGSDLDVNGDVTIDGDIVLDDGGTFTTTVQTVTPTANRTISFPDATGTLALVAGSSGQLVYNNAGVYAGVSTMTFDGTSVTLAGRLINSYTSVASSPAKVFTGTWFTGGTATTTKPHFLIEPTGTTSTAWSTSGTGLGVNAASGFAGRLFDFQVNGTSRAVLDSAGRLLVGTASTSAPSTLLLQGASGGGTAAVSRLCSTNATPATNEAIGYLVFGDSAHSDGAWIKGARDGGTWSGSSKPTRLEFSTTSDASASPTERLRITSAGVLQVADAGNIAVGTTTGTKIGTATTQKLGFFNKTPVVQPAAVADATDAASVITQLNALLARMRDLGLIAT